MALLKTRHLIYCLLPLFCMGTVAIRAQSLTVQLHQVDSGSVGWQQKSWVQPRKFNNQPEAQDYLRQLIPQLQEEGFLAASLDSLLLTDSFIYAWIYIGKPYKWARLSLGAIPKALLDQAGLKQRDWQGKVISPKRMAALSEQLLRYCENNGYPFAHTVLDSITPLPEGLQATLLLDRGKLIQIDTIIVKGNVEIHPGFLQNYLGIKQGALYDESAIRLISKRLQELAFIQEAQPWRMHFTIDKNSLFLFLKEKKANQLNGLIGLQPNTVETGKFMFTADILLGLKNAFGYGESVAATYQNLQFQSPRFHIDATLPYLLGTPFGLEGSFDLFKRDTSFRRTTFEGGIVYQLNAQDYVKVSYEVMNNKLIGADTLYVIRNHTLPEHVDVQTQGVGLTFYKDKTDYKLNPSKGWQARLSASGLLRNVLPNDAITGIKDGSDFSYAGLYDTVNANKYQYRITGNIAWYFRLAPKIVFKAGYYGGYISGNNLFLNELFQLGGFKLLRGFDEQSIYASQYHLGSVELRVLLDRNSYLYLFSDNAFVHAQYGAFKKADYPMGLGLGATLENKSGIFNVAVGVGKRSGTEFQFRQTKIHFGYVAYF